MAVKANSLKNAAKNIWSVAKHKDKGVRFNKFVLLKNICKLSFR